MFPFDERNDASQQWYTVHECVEKLGITKTLLEQILIKQPVRYTVFNEEKLYLLCDLQRIIAQEHTPRKRRGLEKVDAALLEDLKFDHELQELLSVTADNKFHSFVQTHGSFFITETHNGNYNAFNVAAMLSDYSNKPEAENLFYYIAKLLQQKDQLFYHASHIVYQELSTRLFEFVKFFPTFEEIFHRILVEGGMLAMYYSDLALLRLPLAIKANRILPAKFIDFVPYSFVDLVASVKWPPSEMNPEIRQASKYYQFPEKALYILERLHNNNPVEFDMIQTEFIQRWDNLTARG